MEYKKVLIVEDEEDTVDLLRQLFVGVPYQCHFAENKSEALHKVEEWRPDVILLDLKIPRTSQSVAIDKKNGIQLARDANSMIDGLKIIVITGDVSWRLDEILTQESYIYHGFTKDKIDFEQIQNAIEEALST